ncbi:hypothetical protein O3M35_011797 [Rhynocoris fuscipes]|uniref:Uncharacterized protein n=1 Tax=Rhynocoris fuscipes TaxID=488301 RepID=A0AAW1CXJ2_9HEMI
MNIYTSLCMMILLVLVAILTSTQAGNHNRIPSHGNMVDLVREKRQSHPDITQVRLTVEPSGPQQPSLTGPDSPPSFSQGFTRGSPPSFRSNTQGFTQDSPTGFGSRNKSPGFTRDSSTGFTRDKSQGFSQDSPSGFGRDISPEFTRDSSSGFTRDKAPNSSKDKSPGLVRDNSPGFNRDKSQGFIRDTSPALIQDSFSGFNRDKTQSFTPSGLVRDTSPGFINDKSQSLTRDSSSGFNRDTSSTFTRDSSAGFTRESSPTFTRDSYTISESDPSPPLASDDISSSQVLVDYLTPPAIDAPIGDLSSDFSSPNSGTPSTTQSPSTLPPQNPKDGKWELGFDASDLLVVPPLSVNPSSQYDTLKVDDLNTPPEVITAPPPLEQDGSASELFGKTFNKDSYELADSYDNRPVYSFVKTDPDGHFKWGVRIGH